MVAGRRTRRRRLPPRCPSECAGRVRAADQAAGAGPAVPLTARATPATARSRRPPPRRDRHRSCADVQGRGGLVDEVVDRDHELGRIAGPRAPATPAPAGRRWRGRARYLTAGRPATRASVTDSPPALWTSTSAEAMSAGRRRASRVRRPADALRGVGAVGVVPAEDDDPRLGVAQHGVHHLGDQPGTSNNPISIHTASIRRLAVFVRRGGGRLVGGGGGLVARGGRPPPGDAAGRRRRAGSGLLRHGLVSPPRDPQDQRLARPALGRAGFVVDVTETPGDLTADRLAAYRVLVLNNANELGKVLDDKQRKAVEDWSRQRRRDRRAARRPGPSDRLALALATRRGRLRQRLRLLPCPPGGGPGGEGPPGGGRPGGRVLVLGRLAQPRPLGDRHAGVPGADAARRIDLRAGAPLLQGAGRQADGQGPPDGLDPRGGAEGGRFFYTELGHDLRSLDTEFGRRHVAAAIRWAASTPRLGRRQHPCRAARRGAARGESRVARRLFRAAERSPVIPFSPPVTATVPHDMFASCGLMSSRGRRTSMTCTRRLPMARADRAVELALGRGHGATRRRRRGRRSCRSSTG